VQAGANERIVVLDGLEDDLRGIPAMLLLSLRSVRVNADGDLVFLTQLVEAVEAVWVGIGTEHLDAERLAELEELAVGVGVLREVLHAPGQWRDVILLAQFQQGVYLLRRAAGGGVFLVELGVAQAEIFHPLEGRLQIELAESVALRP